MKVLIMLPEHPRLFASSALVALLFSSVVQAQDAPAAAPVEEETYPPAWFRIDSDLGGLQLWAGATHPLSETVGLATDIYVNSGTLGEFDIGPAFTAGSLIITPMVGLQFDWGQKKAAALVPQLYVVGGPDPIYAELWIQNYLYTIFDYPSADTVATDTLYFRLFVDYKLGKYLAIGPQVEATLAVSGDPEETVTSLPIGASIMLSNYGVGNTLLAFLGYETKEPARQIDVGGDEPEDHGLVGRLTFVKNF